MEPKTIQKMHISRDTLCAILERLPVAAFFQDGDVVHLNSAAEELTGYGSTEIGYDKEWFNTLYRKSMERCRDGGSRSPHREVLVRKDGSVRLVDCLAGDDGILLLHDVTCHKSPPSPSFQPDGVEHPKTVPVTLLDLVAIVSLDGRVREMHGAWEEMLGYQKEELLDRSFTEFVHPDDLESAVHSFEALLKDVPVLNVSIRARCKDNSYRWLECKALPPDHQGLIYANFKDITTQKELEQTLRHRERLFRGLFHNAPVGIYQSDADGKHFIANQRWYEYAGVSAEAISPRGSDFSASERDRERISSMWKKALESGKEWSSEYSYRTANGRRVWVHGTALQLLDEKGEIIGYLGCNVDITERKLAEEALRKSEHRFRLAMEATNDGLWDIDLETKRAYYSPGCYRMLGYDPVKDKRSDEEWLELVHAEDLPRTVEAYRKCAENRTAGFEVESRMRSKDGTWKWILSRGKAVAPDLSDRPPRIVGTFVDISDRKMMEEMLRKEHELLNLITETSPVGILFIERSGRIPFVNPRMEEITGFTREELKARGHAIMLERLSSPERDALNPEQIPSQRAIATGGSQRDVCLTFRRKDGRHILLSINSAPFLDADGEIGGVVETIEDVTERKEAEQETRRLNEELDLRVMERTTQLNLAKREMESFSYSVSHDLRAPLRHINSYCTILEEDFADALPLQAHHYLDRICAASTRMGKLIDDLLKLSRINRAEMKLGPFKISKIAQEVAAILREEYAGRDVQFEIADGLVAKGDRFLVRQVLENLMENAMKYTSKHATARIEFGRTMIDGKQAFYVKDDGAGFDMAYADKLFQPFQRLHGSEFEGTGIGLATVKRIVERHGGRVWAYGAVDEGAAFYFTLSGPGRGVASGERHGEGMAA
ncbi:PAS domain S-box protein [Geomonas sp. RF6]|uniref:PAS domain S-box protein n=1 Tax=Geomonas sp. RF6 TaxID=2897342 RepID=UPI001E59BB62|nr:PAS domain S-box protein [Geomonas sp. RF6]UFS70019.1 PAS domain S-box protein [Geomonas sp. RF6]